jgi:hypothetical protein
MLAVDLLMYLPSYVLPVIPSTDFRRLAEWLAHMYQYTRIKKYAKPWMFGEPVSRVSVVLREFEQSSEAFMAYPISPSSRAKSAQTYGLATRTVPNGLLPRLSSGSAEYRHS